MSSNVWSAVDEYVSGLMVEHDAALELALKDSAAAGLPPFNVSPAQGKFLHLLARIHGAKKILEIGTLGGYSAIWLARALPEGGKLITLEANKDYAKVAAANIERAGLVDKIEIRTGNAVKSLKAMEEQNIGSFDMIFIDADKPANPDYWAWAIKMTRPGSVIVVDNVIQNGSVIDAETTHEGVKGIRAMNEMVAAETRVTATTIQTVGQKGYDGFLIALVKS